MVVLGRREKKELWNLVSEDIEETTLMVMEFKMKLEEESATASADWSDGETR